MSDLLTSVKEILSIEPHGLSVNEIAYILDEKMGNIVKLVNFSEHKHHFIVGNGNVVLKKITRKEKENGKKQSQPKITK